MITNEKIFDLLKTKLPTDFFPNSPVAFEKISLDGLEEMYAYSTSSDEFYQYLEYKPFRNIDETRSYLLKLMKMQNVKEPKSYTWFIKSKEKNDKIIGSVRLVDINVSRLSLSWGYGFDRKYWGTGYSQVVQHIMLNYCFDILRFNRLSGLAYLENQQTISSLKLIGMREEGILRQYYRDHSGKYHDAWAYSMLRSDYLAIKNIESQKKISVTKEEVLDKLMQFVKGLHPDIESDTLLLDFDDWDSVNYISLMLFIEKSFFIKLEIGDDLKNLTIRKISYLIESRI
jgi:RimJ/RimL family protein N-acetyltransferase/acyl carrier protein